MNYITFSNPEFLWFLLSLPLLLITHLAFLRNAKVKAFKFANFEAIKRVTGKGLITKNYAILFIRLGTILAVILAVSGTTIYYKGMVNEANYVIALDVSSSMTAQDVSPSRIEAAKLAAKEFVNNISGDTEIGVITFSGETFISQPLTNNKILVYDALNRAEIVKAGGTDIASSLVTGANLLVSTENKSKVIILITDGSNTQGEFIQRSLSTAIEYLQEQKVIVYSLSLGTGEGALGYLPEYYNVSAIYDTEGLASLSNATGGKLYSATDGNDLVKALNDINNTREGFVKVEASFLLLVLSLIMLFIEWGLANTRFRRVA